MNYRNVYNKLPVAWEGIPFIVLCVAITVILLIIGRGFFAIPMLVLTLFMIYFFRDPESYDEKVMKKHWKSTAPERIGELTKRFEALESCTERDVEGVTRTLAGELGISAARLIHPTRLALCGVGFGPGLFELMEVLGRETCIRRLRALLQIKGQDAPVPTN